MSETGSGGSKSRWITNCVYRVSLGTKLSDDPNTAVHATYVINPENFRGRPGLCEYVLEKSVLADTFFAGIQRDDINIDASGSSIIPSPSERKLVFSKQFSESYSKFPAWKSEKIFQRLDYFLIHAKNEK